MRRLAAIKIARLAQGHNPAQPRRWFMKLAAAGWATESHVQRSRPFLSRGGGAMRHILHRLARRNNPNVTARLNDAWDWEGFNWRG